MMGNPTNGLPIFESRYPFQAGIIHTRTNMIVLKEMIMHKQFILFFLLICWIEVSAKSSSQKIVNIAQPSWGTTVTASSVYSSQQSAYKLTDNLFKKGNSWLSRDNAPYPQILTFRFEESISLTQINLYQSTWDGSMYHTKDFYIEGSTDGIKFEVITKGTLPDESNAKWSYEPKEQKYLIIHIVITSGYEVMQSCGLGEVQLMAAVSKDRKPLYDKISDTIDWETYRGHFEMRIGLEPATGPWVYHRNSGDLSPSGRYTSGIYELVVTESSPDTLANIIRWSLKRMDGKPFRVTESVLTCKTSYSGVYKLFTPHRMSQQNYYVDLPFRINHIATSHDNYPVVWMQDTEGNNSLTLGLLNQQPKTVIDGSTYDTANGGEAPGIANSYVRVTFHRPTPSQGKDVTLFSDALYLNANTQQDWFESLRAFSDAVDKEHNFIPDKISEWAMNPMWHSWYAHADNIDEENIRRDAKLANELGMKTIQLDAGWNIPSGQNYSFENEGDYFFSDRFPNAAEMIKGIHQSGQRVVLHVAPLIMGKNAYAWKKMHECLLKVDGKETAYLDPRIKKVQDYLISSWDHIFRNYDVDGLWYDFLEFPNNADQPDPTQTLISTDIYSAYSMLMQSLYDKAKELNSSAVIILRRPNANLNAKSYSTHVWPMDVPQDYNMNRRDVLFLKTLGKGVITHACCTSWAVSESDLNVARQMASITLAGVPALSHILQNSPPSHNTIIKKWLQFYEENKRDLILGTMTPLMPTPPSAAIKIVGHKKTFFGFFEAVPGLIEGTTESDTVIIVNAYKKRTSTRLEGIKEGEWVSNIYDQYWNPVGKANCTTDAAGGINLNIHAKEACHTIILTREKNN